MPTTPDVNPRIPFSLLEAVRRIDTPAEAPEMETEPEYVQELRNKRLGLSETVYQQIRRYGEAVKQGRLLPSSEAAAIGALIARRPDALELFRNAGRIVAAEIYEGISSSKRQLMRGLPSVFARPLALSEIKAIASKYFGGEIRKTDGFLTFTVPAAIVGNGVTGSAGCQYYETAYSELLRLLITVDSQVEHVRCAERGDNECEWRTEWGGRK